MESGMVKERKVWIDWMKSIGMLAIIWGHCFPEGMSAFIYAFNVPVFFVISGYLTHQESSMRVCIDKVWNNLMIPYLILAFIKAAGDMLHHLLDGQWYWSIIAILGGFHHLHDVSGCSNLWFVYTLILIRLIYQAFPHHRIILSVISVIGALIYNQMEWSFSWSVTNVLIALPFFMLGNVLASAEGFEKMIQKVQSMAWWKWLVMLLTCIVVTYIISFFNGSAKMYEGLYGRSFILFVIASITGSCIVYMVSTRLNCCDWKIVRISSIGSIVTLVFHRELLHPLIKWINKMNFDIVIENITLFVSSVIVLLAFVPIIIVVKKVLPIVLGKRAEKVWR